jgi:hypothetical protein
MSTHTLSDKGMHKRTNECAQESAAAAAAATAATAGAAWNAKRTGHVPAS